MQRKLISFAVGVFVTAASLTYAEAAADPCLAGPPMQSYGGDPNENVLTTADLRVPVEMQVPAPESVACDGMTITVERPDGSQRVVVPLTEKVHNEFPTIDTRTGFLTATLAGGAGRWVMTKVTHGANELAASVSFQVQRGATLVLDQPARTSGTAKTVVTGLARRYSTTGALVPAAGVTVRILGLNRATVLATARTGSDGRYSVQLALTKATELFANLPSVGDYVELTTAPAVAHKLLSMSYLTSSPTATVNNYWKVSGTAFPGTLFTTLDFWNGSAWQSTQSFGNTAANGSYARYWKPDRPGTFRMRVSVSGAGIDNSPWSRETTVTVKQLPQAPTYFVGTVVAPTAGLPVLRDSTFSSFGTLKYRRANGTLGPVGNQVVLVHARRVGETAWTVVSSARTAVSGYFYTRWGHIYDAGQSFQVMLTYPTKLPQAASSATGVFGPFTVQP
ncbi:hypothetical protein [Kribbella sp. NPDC051770]|uniref:hypothetical protein n=1 Tax=Kribbella sp. NPDC051770 TaxID=3155413 RepID=UPI00341DFF9E